MHFLDKQYKKTRWLALAFYFMQKTNKTRSACQRNKLHINAEKRGPHRKLIKIVQLTTTAGTRNIALSLK